MHEGTMMSEIIKEFHWPPRVLYELVGAVP